MSGSTPGGRPSPGTASPGGGSAAAGAAAPDSPLVPPVSHRLLLAVLGLDAAESPFWKAIDSIESISLRLGLKNHLSIKL